MNWSIERLETGYGLVKTEGNRSRTVYTAQKAKDAADFLVMAELCALLQGGVPVEMVKPKRKPRGKKVVQP